MNDSKGSHLSIVLDLSPTQWHLSGRAQPTNTYPLPLNTFISQLLAFLNAHIASKHENTLAVFGAFPGKSVVLYSSNDMVTENHPIDANSYFPFKWVDSTIVKRIIEELDGLRESEEVPCALVSALSKALCYVNRITLPSPTTTSNPADSHDSYILPDPRILILSVSPDLSTSYIPIMNSIFSAQKLVTIDVCQIYGPDSVFLQQAAHLTGGSYIFLDRRDALLQYLIASMSFLPPPSIRKTLSVPTQDKVDFRAACFCHKRIIDIGFVCSVCLSIFCQPVPVCSTCRTKFPIKTLQRLNTFRPALPPHNSNSERPAMNSLQPRTIQSSVNGTRGTTSPRTLSESRVIGDNSRSANPNGYEPGLEGRWVTE